MFENRSALHMSALLDVFIREHCLQWPDFRDPVKRLLIRATRVCNKHGVEVTCETVVIRWLYLTWTFRRRVCSRIL